jgi:hypothetical protein
MYGEIKTRVTYQWQKETDDPREIIGVTLEQNHVPRMDETVTIDVINGSNHISKTGKVVSVRWRITQNGQFVGIRLDTQNNKKPGDK